MMHFVRICIAVEGEGGGMDPPHHVGHQQQKSPGLPRAQPLIRIRGVVLRGELQEKIRGRPVIILTIVRFGQTRWVSSRTVSTCSSTVPVS